MLFYLLCIYISLYYIRPFEWVDGLKGTPIFLVVGVMSIIGLFCLWAQNKIKFFRFKTDWMVLGFTVAIILSHLRHGDFYLIIPSCMKFFPALVGYFLVVYGLDTQKKIKLFTILLIGLSVFLSYEAYVQAQTGFAHGGMEPVFDWGVNSEGTLVRDISRARWYGMFNDPNDLGLALVLAVPFLIKDLFLKRYLLPIICLPILTYGLYLTNSRGAMLAMAASIFCYVVLHRRSAKGVVIGVLIAGLMMTIGPSRMTDVSASEGSAHGRLEAWYQGFQMFKAYPLFGVGRGMFTEWHSLTAHNSFVLVLSELGLFGSFFFLGLFYIPLRWAKTHLLAILSDRNVDVIRMSYYRAAIGCLVGLLSAMFFLSRSYILLPFMIVGLITAAANTGFGSTEADVFDFRPKEAFLVLIGFVVFIVIFVKVLI